MNSFKFKWSYPPRKIILVDPYIIGFGEKGIEMHHYYMPNVVWQFDENMSAQTLAGTTTEYVGLLKEITENMPSFFVIMQRQGKISMCKFEQTKLEDQCNIFIKANEYKLALNMCDAFIRRNYRKAVTTEEYVEIQRERGYHLFLVDKNYKKAKSIFEKYKVPPEEVLLLFAELLHKSNVEKLIEIYEIDCDSTPFFCSLYSVEDAVIPANRMNELAKQIKVFLLFFLDKRKAIIEGMQEAKKNLFVGGSQNEELKIEKDVEKELEKLSFLKMLYEVVFFHGCLILIICQDPDASLVLKEFNKILSEENSLPPSICEDLLLKYDLIQLLFQVIN